MADTGNYEVGSAFISIKPKTDDFSKQLKDEVGDALGDAGREGGQRLGDGLSNGISAKAVAIGNLVSEAIITAGRAAAEALGQTMQQAFEGFARFEQLSGGAEILFGTDALDVLENAQQAFETAGLSANDYLEQVMGFSSSLINSLGGDTDAAARMADMALRDMSDNVNTFGTDVSSVQRAYQGFARGQFGMLDNLRLGYEGNISEMQRLLDKAEELSGVHYDIGNYADIVEAIHVVQTEMGVTGKTAAEAASTVEGSLASLNAAWQNWLTELGKGDANVERVTEDLVQAFGNALRNVIPLIGRIIGGMIAGFPQLVSEAMASMPDVLAEVFSAVFGEAVGEGVGEALRSMGESLAPLGEAFAEVGAFASEVFGQIAEGIEAVSPLMQPLFDAVAGLADVLVGSVLPVIVQILGSAIVEFIAITASGVAGLMALLGQLVAFASGIPSSIMSAFSSLQETLSGVFEGAAQRIRTAFEGVVSFFASIPDQIIGFFSGIAGGISSAFSSIKLPSLHIDGSLNPAEWLTTGKLPQISFYAQGGIADSATLGVFGEAGPEALVPLSPQRLQPFGDAVADAMGGKGRVTNVYIDGAQVNSDEAVENLFYDFMRELSRLNSMGAVAYG